jgi:dihydrofolate reductase
MTPRVTLIVARARNGVIGRDNAMPWRIAGEQAFFKRVTMGHPIIMGRKTWESIGRPLPGRRSIVVSRNPAYSATGAEVVASLEQAMARCDGAAESFVIGGAELYRAALPRADRLLITEIDADFDGDAFMDAPDPTRWRESAREPLPEVAPAAPRGFAVDFVTYTRR